MYNNKGITKHIVLATIRARADVATVNESYRGETIHSGCGSDLTEHLKSLKVALQACNVQKIDQAGWNLAQPARAW